MLHHSWEVRHLDLNLGCKLSRTRQLFKPSQALEIKYLAAEWRAGQMLSLELRAVFALKAGKQQLPPARKVPCKPLCGLFIHLVLIYRSREKVGEGRGRCNLTLCSGAHLGWMLLWSEACPTIGIVSLKLVMSKKGLKGAGCCASQLSPVLWLLLVDVQLSLGLFWGAQGSSPFSQLPCAPGPSPRRVFSHFKCDEASAIIFSRWPCSPLCASWGQQGPCALQKIQQP